MGPHYAELLIVLLPIRPSGVAELTRDEIAELFGGMPEYQNWANIRGPLDAPLAMTDQACAVRAGRNPDVGEIWAFERRK